MRRKSKTDVEVFLIGGLGNQLFGWAAAYTLAKKLDVGLTLNTSQLKSRSLAIPHYILEDAKLSCREPSYYKCNTELARRIYRHLPRRAVYFERKYSYERRFHDISRPVELHGYFQSINYFKKEKSTVARVLLSEEKMTSQYDQVRRGLPKKFISLHFRRGDYLQKTEVHPLTDRDYYNTAITYLGENLVDNPIVVFTDDKSLAREFFPNLQIVSNSELSSPFENLLLMSKAEAIIGANSTFSLWAGILMKNPEHLRIFPKKWFGPGFLSSDSPVPPTYTQF
jgi:hypothetical protein